MRLHSDIITARDIHAATPADVAADVSQHGSRSRARAFEVSLEGLGGRHTRKKNSGNRGAGYEYAASWDDWGVWLARLFEIDPNMTATYYKDRADFYAQTARYVPAGMRSPWLIFNADGTTEPMPGPITWPDETQQAADAERIERKRKQALHDEARQLQRRAERLLEQV
jgi:hypothetical protein